MCVLLFRPRVTVREKHRVLTRVVGQNLFFIFEFAERCSGVLSQKRAMRAETVDTADDRRREKRRPENRKNKDKCGAIFQKTSGVGRRRTMRPDRTGRGRPAPCTKNRQRYSRFPSSPGRSDGLTFRMKVTAAAVITPSATARTAWAMSSSLA